MLIPSNRRRLLRDIGHYHLFWYRIDDWAFGERYKFKNGVVAYLFDNEIVTLRRGATILWRREKSNG